FMTAFNERDMPALEKTFNFPHVRFAMNTVRITMPGDHTAAIFEQGSLASWSRSEWRRRKIIHAGADKVHIDTQGARYRGDGTLLAIFDSIYMLTCDHGHWGIQARSSYAP
ncbi:MAG TPA: hypothetical protein VHV27_12330, partial [Phenylobacterium sp.]|nr:hypothetical protein [Phenylobacterium sp.]